MRKVTGVENQRESKRNETGKENKRGIKEERNMDGEAEGN